MHTSKQVHQISLLATVHIATTMVLTNEPKVSVSDDGDLRTVTFAFAAGQQATMMVKAGRLHVLTLTLRAGCQPSIRGLENALAARFEVPLFADYGLTSYEAVGNTGQPLRAAPILLRTLQIIGDRSKFLADLLEHLADVDITKKGVDDTTNHIGVVSAMIAQYRIDAEDAVVSA